MVEQGRPAQARVPEFDGIADACAWLTSHRVEIEQALLDHGALLLRGLPVRDVETFASVRDVLIAQPAPYREKATPRSDLGSAVFSSTDLPPAQAIQLHNENSYTLNFPGRLLFGCLDPPDTGGATPVADVRTVLAALPPGIVETVKRAGWSLVRNYHDQVSLSWKKAFATDSREAVESYCADNLIQARWTADGGLATRQVRPGIIHHPVTGEPVWFNHLAFWNSWSLDEMVREALVDEYGVDGLPFETRYGDGRRLSRAEVAGITAAYDGATVREPWRRGDVLLVDNILAAHGRDPFRGSRTIVVAMGDAVRLADCAPTVAPAAGQWPADEGEFTGR